MKRKINIAMSGGIDSSIAALLLKEQGHEVAGVTMCLGLTTERNTKAACCGPKEIEDARRVCHTLGIKHYIFDFSQELQSNVISNFLSEYAQGRTPNPCIECNRLLKFEVLLKKTHALDFDLLATGHYADIAADNGTFYLKRPKDNRKDQTYFLYSVKKETLKYCVFPLADYTKKEVRSIARDRRLPVADKTESQDICFIPEKGLKAFLETNGCSRGPGNIVDENGNVLANHKGTCFYTIGQRAGLGISGKVPLYVITIDSERNQIIVGEKRLLKSKGLIADNLNILVDSLPKYAWAKIRYSHKPSRCSISVTENELRVVFDEPQEAITPGQSVVLYDNDIVLGGGIIREGIAYE